MKKKADIFLFRVHECYKSLKSRLIRKVHPCDGALTLILCQEVVV